MDDQVPSYLGILTTLVQWLHGCRADNKRAAMDDYLEWLRREDQRQLVEMICDSHEGLRAIRKTIESHADFLLQFKGQMTTKVAELDASTQRHLEEIKTFLMERLPELSPLNQFHHDACTNARSETASILVDILIFIHQFSERSNRHGWADDLYTGSKAWAVELRGIAIVSQDDQQDIVDTVKTIANYCDRIFQEVLNNRTPSCCSRVEALMLSLQPVVTDLKQRLSEDLPGPERATTELRKEARKILELAGRTNMLIENNCVDDLEYEGSVIGESILRICHWRFDTLSEEDISTLRELGTELHLLGTAKSRSDGGQAIRFTQNAITKAAQKTAAIAAKMRVTLSVEATTSVCGQ